MASRPRPGSAVCLALLLLLLLLPVAGLVLFLLRPPSPASAASRSLSLSPMAAADFVADADAAQLAAGRQPATYGLVVVAGWPPQPLQLAYEAWLARLAQQLGSMRHELLLYDFHHLHCTVATLASFRTGHLRHAPQALRTRHRDVWVQAIRRAVEEAEAGGSWPRAFQLQTARPFLSAAAGCLSYTCDGPQMAAVRQTMRRAREIALALQPDLPAGPEDFNVPGIIHSTVLRFVKPPSDPQRLRQIFEAAADEWMSVTRTLPIDKVVLAVEDVPYMHVPPDRTVAAFMMVDD